MKHALALFLVWVLVPLHAANFPTEYQSALRLYVSNKFNEAKDAFAVLIASAPNAETKDAALAQATRPAEVRTSVALSQATGAPFGAIARAIA